MKALIQRVKQASVKVNNKLISEINKGYLVLVGFNINDIKENIPKLAKKIINLRIFDDPEGKMNFNINDVKGELLVVSQFTLYANTNEGNRPSFCESMKVDQAREFYELFVEEIKKYQIPVKTGIFQAEMEVSLVNDGPCTISIEIN